MALSTVEAYIFLQNDTARRLYKPASQRKAAWAIPVIHCYPDIFTSYKVVSGKSTAMNKSRASQMEVSQDGKRYVTMHARVYSGGKSRKLQVKSLITKGHGKAVKRPRLEQRRKVWEAKREKKATLNCVNGPRLIQPSDTASRASNCEKLL